MLLSKTCIYGIRAVLYTAGAEGRKYVPISTISRELGISFHFLTKILQTLTQKNLMRSYRGPNGGITLARAATEMKLIEIVEAIDGDGLFSECLLGLPGCGRLKPCPLHEQWDGIRSGLQAMLADTTVAGMARRVKENGLRLSELDIEE